MYGCEECGGVGGNHYFSCQAKQRRVDKENKLKKEFEIFSNNTLSEISNSLKSRANKIQEQTDLLHKEGRSLYDQIHKIRDELSRRDREKS